MNGWLIAPVVVGYLAMGVASARVADWLLKQRMIFIHPADVAGVMVVLMFLWPVIVSGWLVVRAISALVIPRRFR